MIYEEYSLEEFPKVEEDYKSKEKYMNLTQLMQFLDGKKTIIAGIIMTTASYLAAKMILDVDTVVFINGITTLVFGSAAVKGKQMRDSGEL